MLFTVRLTSVHTCIRACISAMSRLHETVNVVQTYLFLSLSVMQEITAHQLFQINVTICQYHKEYK